MSIQVSLCLKVCCLSLMSKIAFATPCMPISSLPFIIEKPGNYCLTGHLENQTDQNAITIAASGVVLDLKNFTLSSYNKRSNTVSFGIFSQNCRDITIQNGTITGFMYGIYLADLRGSDTDLNSLTGGHLISQMTIKASTFRGIRIEGAQNQVKNTQIIGVGGSTVYNDAFAMGIESIGPGASIENNVIKGIYGAGKGEAVGISFSNNSSGSSATGNVIDNKLSFFNKPKYVSRGNQFGIWVGGNTQFKTNVYLRENIIRNITYGITFSSTTTGWYSNNQIEHASKCAYFICSSTASAPNHKGAVCCTDE